MLMKKIIAKCDIAYWEGYVSGLKETAMIIPGIDQANYMNKLLYAYKKLDDANKTLVAIEASELFNDDLTKVLKEE